MHAVKCHATEAWKFCFKIKFNKFIVLNLSFNKERHELQNCYNFEILVFKKITIHIKVKDIVKMFYI
jgi:hypothetical protein